jgi:Secretion system C-terminal sorting domain
MAQKDLILNINHKLSDQAFQFNLPDVNNEGNTFSITRLEYYLSNIRITHDGGLIDTAAGVYALVNAGNNTSIELGSFDISQVEKIEFCVGVNQPENNGDPALWPSDHPLAPKTPSMHWGWAAGYRFVALEGKSGPNLNTTFQFHALGNQNYYNAFVNTSATEVNDQLVITLDADYTKALYNIDVSQGPTVHGETGLAVTVLLNFKNRIFTAAENSTAVTSVPGEKDIKIYPNPSTGEMHIQVIPSGYKVTKLEIMDLTGKRFQSLPMDNDQELTIWLPNPGFYLISFWDQQERLYTSKVLVH